ncbi:MAG: hypothetical protein IPL48_15895 [Bacteroidetes bacterium]|nr:hypothetical protein [Bacteroidota bacterium]
MKILTNPGSFFPNPPPPSNSPLRPFGGLVVGFRNPDFGFPNSDSSFRNPVLGFPNLEFGLRNAISGFRKIQAELWKIFHDNISYENAKCKMY